MKSISQIKNSLVQITNHNNSGVASLLSVIQYYGSVFSMEQLRILSGTNGTGTTFLGLTKAANKVGFIAKGVKMGIYDLLNHQEPVILSVISKQQQQSYAVYFGSINIKGITKYILGDPLNGISYLSDKEIETLWSTNICLLLQKTEDKTQNQPLPEKLYSFLKQDKRLLFIVGFLSLICSVLITLPSAMVINKIVEFWLTKPTIPNYIYLFLLALLIIGFEIFVNLKGRFSIIYSQFIVKNIRTKFYNQFFNLPKQYFDTFLKGELIGKSKEIDNIQSSIMVILSKGIENCLTILLILLILPFFYWKALLFILPCLFCYLFWLKKTEEYILPDQTKLNDSQIYLDINFNNICENIESIKTYNKLNVYLHRLKQVNDFYSMAFYRNQEKKGNYFSYVHHFCIFFFFVLLTFLWREFSNHTFTLGIFISTTYLCVVLSIKILDLFQISNAVSIAKANLREIQLNDFVRDENEKPIENVKIEEIESIEIKNLGYLIDSQNKKIIENINFSLSKGNIIGVVGKSGSGKTTICNILMKQYSLSIGEVKINDTVSIEDISSTDWLKIASFVPKEPIIFNGSILDNIGFEEAIHAPYRILEFMKEFDFNFFFQSLPKREQTVVGDGKNVISSTQKHMISLARALYKKPKLLIIDEPSQFVSPEMEQYFQFVLEKIKVNTCVILFTNNHSIADKYCQSKFNI